MCILARYYTPDGKVVTDDSYKFSSSGTYFAPGTCSFDDLMSYLRGLPIIDDPEVFMV